MSRFFAGIAVLGLLGGCSDSQPSSHSGQSVPAASAYKATDPLVAKRVPFAATVPPVEAGGLLTYDSTRKVVHVKGAAFYPVGISETSARNAIGSRALNLTEPNGRVIRLTYLNHVEHPGGRWTWIGRNLEGEIGSLTFGNAYLSGTIPRSGDTPLRVGRSEQGAWLAETAGGTVAQAEGAPFSIASAPNPEMFMTATGPSGQKTALAATVGRGPAALAKGKAVPTSTSKRMARHDVDGDGRADIFWKHQVYTSGPAQHLSIWFMKGASVQGGRFFESLNDGGGTFLDGLSDMDGDGAADVVFHQEQLGSHLLQYVSPLGPYYYSTTVHRFTPGTYPGGWRTVALLDMNGDAKSDIAWNQDDSYCVASPQGTEQLSRWYLDSGVLLGGRLDVLGECRSSWQDAPIFRPGDFNGDGLGDMAIVNYEAWYEGGAWHSWRYVRILLTNADGSFVVGDPLTLPSPSGQSELIGTGDMNHDGKADLVIKEHSPTWGIRIWYMDGLVHIGSSDFFAQPQPLVTYNVAAIADFDGDGYDDLLWAGRPTIPDLGYVLMWRMQPNGQFEGSYVGAYPHPWYVINSLY